MTNPTPAYEEFPPPPAPYQNPGPTGGAYSPEYGATYYDPYGAAYNAHPVAGPGRLPMPKSVSVASILLFISGAFAVLSGFAVLGVANGNGAVAGIGVIVLLLGVLEIVVGVSLRRFRPWARWATVVLCGSAALLQILGAGNGASVNAVGALLNGLVVVLMFRSDTIAAFPSRRR